MKELLRIEIKKALSEAFGDGKREFHGAITFTAGQLVDMAYSNKRVNSFIRKDPSNKEGAFDFAWDLYVSNLKNWNLPPPREDRETVMYDFLSKYDPQIAISDDDI